MKRKHLISTAYMRLLQEMGKRKGGWGGSSFKHAERVATFAKELRAQSLLDYGCGQGTLREPLLKLYPIDYREYDPVIAGKHREPAPADLVVCTDVMEHVEAKKVDNVLDHINKLARKGVFFVIATRKANKLLPDGRNAHITLHDPTWWLVRLAPRWPTSRVQVIARKEGGGDKEVRVWCIKNDTAISAGVQGSEPGALS